MKKERLKRLKSLALALVIVTSLAGCKNEEKGYEEVDTRIEQTEENSENITAVFFIEGKAMIYTGDKFVGISEENSYIEGMKTRFSTGVEVVKTRTLEDAIEIATAIVGEDNIIYFDYNEKDMVLSHTKTK